MRSRAARRLGALDDTAVARPRWLRRGAVVVVFVGAVLAVAAWATASPTGASPDEDFHITSIWCPRALEGSCPTVPTDSGRVVVVPQQVAWSSACIARNPERSAACTRELGPGPVQTARVDAGEYPGGFYVAMHWLVGSDVDRSVVAMRLVNGVGAVALLGTAVALLSAPSRRLVLYGGLVVAVPTSLYLIASVNPSGWAIIGVALSWIGLHGFLTEQAARRRWGLLGVAVAGAVLAATARGDAGAFVVLAAAVIAIMHADRLRQHPVKALAPLAAAGVGLTGFLAAAHSAGIVPWFGSRVAGGITGEAGGTAPDPAAGLGAGVDALTAPEGVGLLLRNIFSLPEVLLDALAGPLNWLDTPMPAITRLPVAVFATAVAVGGLRTTNLRKNVALLVAVGSFCAIPLLMLKLSGNPVGADVQGRYITPLLPVILMTALWDPIRSTVERMPRTQSVVVTVALAVAHSAALFTQIRRFTTGLGAPTSALGVDVEWWNSPISPMATWVLGSVGFALVASAIVVVSRRDGASGTNRSSAGAC